MCKKILITISIASFLTLSNTAAVIAESGKSAADVVQEQSLDQANKMAAEKELSSNMKKFEELREPIIKGASDAMKDIIEAIELLRSGESKKALIKLQEADGKLDIAIAAEPDLAFFTFSSEIEIFRLLDVPSLKANNERIKRDLAFAEDLLEDGYVQEARGILMNMRDEIVISNTSLPLATYPAALKRAVAQLSDNKKETALATLENAMNTLVTTNTVIPLPVFDARNAVNRASEMDKKNKSKVLSTLSYAQRELEQAKLLGYFHEDSEIYENIEERLEELIEEVEGKNLVEKFYTDLKAEFNKLWQKVM